MVYTGNITINIILHAFVSPLATPDKRKLGEEQLHIYTHRHWFSWFSHKPMGCLDGNQGAR